MKDFVRCRGVLEYMLSMSIPFPDAGTCDLLVINATRNKNAEFVDWLLPNLQAAKRELSEEAYASVATMQYSLKDYTSGIRTFNTMRSKGIVPSYDTYCTQLTALAHAGELPAFMDVAENIKDQQLNFFSLATLKMLSVLTKKKDAAGSAQLFTTMKSVLKPNIRTYAPLLHVACRLDDHTTFYSLLGELHTVGVTPTTDVFLVFVDSLERTGKMTPKACIYLMDTLRGYQWALDETLINKIRAKLPPEAFNAIMNPAPNSASSPETATVPSVPSTTPRKFTPKQSTPAQAERTPEIATKSPNRNERRKSPAALKSNLINSLVAKFAKEDLSEARKALNEVQATGFPLDLAFYADLMEELLKATSNPSLAMELLTIMKDNGIPPNTQTYNSILCRLSSPNQVRKLLDEMTERGVQKNADTYGAYLSILESRRHYAEISNVIEQMEQQNIPPNIPVLTILLSYYSRIGKPEKCEGTLTELRRQGGHIEPVLYNELVLAACKAKEPLLLKDYLELAKDNSVFPDENLYLACIRVFEEARYGKYVISLLHDMLTRKVPVQLEVFKVVLQAILDQKDQDQPSMKELIWEMFLWLLDTMKSQNVTPESILLTAAFHYAQRADIEHLRKLEAVMKEYSAEMTPEVHGNLVASLALQGKVTEARQVLQELDVGASGPAYTMLVRTLASTGNLEECETLLEEMVSREVTQDVLVDCKKIVQTAKEGDNTVELQP